MLLHLSKDLSLPIDAVTQTFAFLARRGAGKTYGASKLCEEMLGVGAQVVVLDPVGNWYGLRLGADGKSKGLAIPVFGGLRGDIPLEPGAGALVADLVVDRELSVVLDVSMFRKGDCDRQERGIKMKNRKGLARRQPAERFWKFVSAEPNTGCWLWTGTGQGNGYGLFWALPKRVAAHRASWELANGPIPDGLLVPHKCDVRLCVNPDHLFLGTQSENLFDMSAKGRHFLQRNPERAMYGELAPAAKLTWAIAREIRRRRSEGVSTRQLAKEAGVSKVAVLYVLRNETWRESTHPTSSSS